MEQRLDTGILLGMGFDLLLDPDLVDEPAIEPLRPPLDEPSPPPVDEPLLPPEPEL